MLLILFGSVLISSNSLVQEESVAKMPIDMAMIIFFMIVD